MCVRVCALTQPLAELRGRRRQTGDAARVAAQVLVLRRRRNVPHLHRRVSAVRRTTVTQRERGAGVTMAFSLGQHTEINYK